MQDISNNMLEFKDAIRHVWNAYFAKSDSPMSPETQNAFESIELGLFQTLVLTPLDMFDRSDQYRQQPLSFIHVQPARGGNEMPLQIGKRDANGNMVWEMPISVLVDDQSIFEFFDFFDWYPYGYIDLPYVRARVASLPSQPSLQGAMVLIEQIHCRFSAKSMELEP